MLIDVYSLRRNDGASFKISKKPDLTEYAEGFSDVSVEGEIVNISGVTTFFAKIEGNYATVCDRCGDETVIHIETVIDTVFDENGTKDDSLVFSGGKIDFEQTVAAALIVAIPMQILCKEDCKGVAGEGYEIIIEN